MSRRVLFCCLALGVLVVAATVMAGCTGPSEPSATGDIKKFSSVSEIRPYIEENTKLAAEAEGDTYWSSGGPERGVATDTVFLETVPDRSSAKAVAAVPPAASGVTQGIAGTGSVEHSQTNVQVVGVDEPDFVKNDGKYIYLVSGDELTIVDAYPPSAASVVSKTMLDNSPREIFLSGNRLVLFTTGYGSSGSDAPVSASAMKAMPYYRSYSPSTHVVFYNITDRKIPKFEKEYTVDGDYVDARLIGNNLYLVSRESISLYGKEDITPPCLRENLKCVVTPDVWYFDNPERQYAFTTVTSFDTAAAKEKDAKTFLIGSGNIMYVSPDAMYISYQKYHNIYRRGGVASTPAISSPSFLENFNFMNEAEKQRILAEMKAQEEEKLQKKEIEQTTTSIHRIAIDNGAIAYVAKGEVPGSLKNQFAMDEYNNNLRVATTSNVYTSRGSYEYNNVYVLDPGMKTIGSLTHIAEQEKIYSTRFMGDRLYMVTFKRMDPFFVIDLANPSAPKILGKLKIPGYSDYLHPYDQNTIIGLGKETGTNEWGGVSTKGLKLALFDVTDVAHPRQIGKVEIGDAGSDSAALSDHKAFLFDKGKNILVIPARVVNASAVSSYVSRPGSDMPGIWYGAYVFGVDPATGFIVKGTVQHGTGDNGYYYYGSSKNEVKRSLYIGDTLYTLSTAKILASPLNSISTTVATIPLDNRGDVLYPPVVRYVE